MMKTKKDNGNIDNTIQLQRHPKSNREMATQLCKLCDYYWENELTEIQLIHDLQHLISKYSEYIWEADGKLNGTIIHKLGKKRSKLINTICPDMQIKIG